jgi:hypothetical protein
VISARWDERVQLDLVDAGNNLGGGQDCLEIFDAEIGNPNTFGQTFGVNSFHCLPKLWQSSFGQGPGRVDEEKVHMRYTLFAVL